MPHQRFMQSTNSHSVDRCITLLRGNGPVETASRCWVGRINAETESSTFHHGIGSDFRWPIKQVALFGNWSR